MATNVIIRTDITGTSFTLDVTALELSATLTLLDFEITHNGSLINNYAKTSQTLLTYSGVSVALGTRVVARRTTNPTPAETTFISTSTAIDLSNALNKLRQKTDELDARITYTLGQLSAGGVVIGTSPVNNAAYGATWSTDTNAAPSRSTAYNQLQIMNGQITTLAPLISPALTGVPTAPTAIVQTSTTQLATTAFVKNSVAGNSNVLASVNVTGNNVLTSAIALTTVLGSSSFRAVFIRASFISSGNGKSPAIIIGQIRDNANNVIETRVNSVNNVGYLDSFSLSLLKVYLGSFTGTYTFTLFISVQASVATDVYSMSSINIETLFFA